MNMCCCESIPINRPSPHDSFVQDEKIIFHPQCPIERHREKADEYLAAEVYNIAQTNDGQWVDRDLIDEETGDLKTEITEED